MLSATRAGKDVEVLQHDADPPAHFGRRNVHQVDAIEEHLARREVVKTRQQPHDGALAGTCRTDDCEFLPRFDVERHVFQYRPAVRISKVQVADVDGADQPRRQTRRLGRLVDPLAPVERLENPFGARHRAEQHVVLFADRYDRPEQHVDELREQHDAAERNRLLQHVAAAEPDDRADRCRADAVDECAIERFEFNRSIFFAAVLPVDLRITREVAVLAAIELYDLNAG